MMQLFSHSSYYHVQFIVSFRGTRGRDRMVVEFTCTVSAYHH